ncbi:MAG: response regulator [Chloroflexus aggregans]|uniref:Response regulator n=1 Tax=Chloroflexus aggregans TaxID=152260 RepID=A0A2J6WRI9_9CHLR|nr:MAG: response regulator [Chloroflexus aggregans]
MRILIVDDESSTRSTLQRLMAKLRNAKIDMANNGADGLKLARQHWYDLIITDYHMPKMDGIDLIYTLRQEGYMIPMVLISGDPAVGGYAVSAGANLFLHKPIDIDDLRTMLDMLGL